jgi:hypothetical protein
MSMKYFDKNKENVKKALHEIASDLENIKELVVQIKNKDGSYTTLSTPDMNSFKMMVHKANLEHIAIHTMIQENQGKGEGH